MKPVSLPIRRTTISLLLVLAMVLAAVAGLTTGRKARAAEVGSWVQTDWSDGPGEDKTSTNTTRYESDDGNIDAGAFGKIQLKQEQIESSWSFDDPALYSFDPAEVEVTGSIASLVEKSPWMGDDWSSRIPVTVSSAAALTENDYQLRIEIDSSSAGFWAQVAPDGSDMRFTGSDAVTEIPFWIEDFDYSGQEAIVWVKAASVEPGDNTLYLYFDNPSASSASSIEDTFSYDSPQELYYMLFEQGNAQDLLVGAYLDGTEVTNGSSTLNLDTRQVDVFPGAEITFANPLSSNGAISGRSVADCCDTIAPVCFAGTRFAYPASRGNDRWHVYAPFSDAQVTIYDYPGGGVSSTFSVPEGTAVTQPASVSQVGILESDVPVIATYQMETTGDSEVLYPACLELYGISSGDAYVAFLEDGTTLQVYSSSGGNATVTGDRGEVYQTGFGGMQGTGDAIHLVADKPVAASSQADADGYESMAFWSPLECGTNYVICGDTQYISGATLQGETEITVLNPDGSVYTTSTTAGSDPPYPHKFFFGNSSKGSPGTIVFQEGTQVIADKPIFLYHEYVNHSTCSDGDETNVLSFKQARKLIQPEPSISMEAPQTRFPTDNPTITTLTGYEYLSADSFVENLGPGNGGTVRYQVSPDGTSYYFHDGISWQLATAGFTHTNNATEVNANLATLPGPGTLYVKAYLVSDGSQAVEVESLEVGHYRYPGSATLVSSTFEPSEEVRWGDFSWQETKPAGASVALDVSTDGGENYEAITNGQAVGSSSESFKYRVTLATTDPLVTPELSYVKVEYRKYEDNGPDPNPDPTPPTPPPPPKKATHWYFAEGYTGDSPDTGERFESWVLVQNPNQQEALARITFMIPGGEVLYIMDPVLPAQSRYTIKVDDIPGLENTEFSTEVEVTNDVPVVCERAMYFNYRGKVGGHDTIGATEASTEWFLAEGFTVGDFFDTYILVQNPGERTAKMRATFMLPNSKSFVVYEDTVPPHSRYTIPVDELPGMAEVEFSTRVESLNEVPLVCERAMYFDSDGRVGGHSTIGASSTAPDWYLPEGYTGGGFDTWLLMQNPSERKAEVKVTLMKQEGQAIELYRELGPRSRNTLHLDEVEGLSDQMVSTEVSSQNGVELVCERAMYFEFNGRNGGHSSIGASSATTWLASEGDEPPCRWCMSEGSAAQGFDTYVLVQNPTDDVCRARFKFMTSTGQTVVEEHELRPRSRFTRCLGQVEGLTSDAVSTEVESLNGVSIICERSTYFDFSGFVGGHDSIGYGL